MVEGHGVKRVCERHKKVLLNKMFKCDSPNGRFKEGAKLINNKLLYRIESVGKNLFYFFLGNSDQKKDSTVVHVHFGMSGRFFNSGLGNLPEPTPTTRLRMINKEANVGALLSAMTCNYGNLSLYAEKRAKLGVDPLREDADKKVFFGCTIHGTKAQRRAFIGDVLMDQSKIAGVGNIYRAEICYKARIHPLARVNCLAESDMDRVWFHSVDLLQRGYSDGSILTIDEEDKRKPSFDGRRRYIYNQRKCLCGAPIRAFTQKARNCYVCSACQVLPKTDLDLPNTPTRPVKLFRSHCAPDAVKLSQPEKLSVKEIKAILSEFGVSTKGKKADLVARLHHTTNMSIPVGVNHLKMASAQEALKEKLMADEKRNVEHVALADEESVRLLGNSNNKRGRRRKNDSSSRGNNKTSKKKRRKNV
jgi:formamidopyrimidine-DNA glycosylase